MIRPRLLLLTGCLLSAIAPSQPAIAQTSYSLESWQGDVRLTRSGGREQRLTRQTGRRLDAPDQLRLQGRRSWANVRCPQGLVVRWNEVRQSRSVEEICNSSGTISRSMGSRGIMADLSEIATCEFVPKTYFAPQVEQFSWPMEPTARRYRVEWVDRDRQVTIWQTSTAATQLSLTYRGPRLTGRRYGLQVTAIGANNRPISTYSLNHVLSLPSESAQTFASDWAEITGDRTLMPDSLRWARADLALSVSRAEGDPELWWTVVAQLSPEADTKSPMAHLRLALAYLHLNRGTEAQRMARRALAAIGQSPSMSRAEALLMLAKASMVINDYPEATRALTEARSIYQGLSETSQVQAIDFVFNQLDLRSNQPCSN